MSQIIYHHTPFCSETIKDNEGKDIVVEKRINLVKEVSTTIYEVTEVGDELKAVVLTEELRNYPFSVPAKPRISFAGVVEKTSENEVVIHIGASMVSPLNPREQFSKKKGRSIAAHRAKTEPIANVTCKLEEIYPVFHHACKQLEPTIRKNRKTWSDIPAVLTINVEEILAEQSPD